MAYNIIFLDEKVIAKDIAKMGKDEITLVFKKIATLSTTGAAHAQVKKLKNYPVADFRLRIGSRRVLFNIDYSTHEIVIFRILHRSQLY